MPTDKAGETSDNNRVHNPEREPLVNATPKKHVRWELPTDAKVFEVVKRRLLKDMRERWLPSNPDEGFDYTLDELMGTFDLRLDDDASTALFKDLEKKAGRAVRRIMEEIAGLGPPVRRPRSPKTRVGMPRPPTARRQ